jgi:hypothetical protein
VDHPVSQVISQAADPASTPSGVANAASRTAPGHPQTTLPSQRGRFGTSTARAQGLTPRRFRDRESRLAAVDPTCELTTLRVRSAGPHETQHLRLTTQRQAAGWFLSFKPPQGSQVRNRHGLPACARENFGR